MTRFRIIDSTEPREINRYQVADSDVCLIHLQYPDGGEEIWAALAPEDGEKFVPEQHSECFIVATSADELAGLAALSDAISRCARAVGRSGRVPPGEF